MQYSQEHLKTMVYAEFGGANRVYYGQLENREWENVKLSTLFAFRLYRTPTSTIREKRS